MTKREFKKILQEGKNRAFELWDEDFDLYQGKLQDYILKLFKGRECEAQEVLWEHERYRIDKKDPELHAYWKRSYAAYRAANYYTRHIERELAYLDSLSKWGKEV